MKQKNSRSFLAGLMAAIMVLSGLSGITLAFAAGASTSGDYVLTKMNDVTINTKKNNSTEITVEEETAQYEDDDIVTIIVQLEDKAVLENKGVIRDTDSGRSLTSKGKDLESALLSEQKTVEENISREVFGGEDIDVIYNYTLVFNGFAFEAPFGTYEDILNVPGVHSADVAAVFDVPKTDFDGGSTVTPNMHSAGDMVFAPDAWDLGYDGTGTLVAVLDTGLYTDHEAFMTAPDTLKVTLSDMQAAFDANELKAEQRLSGLTAEMAYLRDKVPYVFDYVGNDVDVNHGHSASSSDHGTHVAGIAVADPQEEMNGLEGVYAYGVAPQAQLAVMKVFGDSGGGASWSNIIAAIEDCIYIGADVANLSLGSTLGFPTQPEQYAAVYDILDQYGVSIAAAGGNEYSSGMSSSWGTNMNTTENVDSSMIGSPSTYADSLSVAAISNTTVYYSRYITIAETNMGFADAAAINGHPQLQFDVAFGGQTLEYVVIPGLGDVADFDGIDVAGKIALIQRGELDFETKQLNAYNAGAIGVIVYDNVASDALINMSMPNNMSIPSIFISLVHGTVALENAVDGVGSVYISDSGSILSNPAAGKPTDFSNWGPLSDLTIKPEISAPGGDIMSTVDPLLGDGSGNSYASYSGTSMASPNAAGSIAVVRQYVEERFPDLTPEEKVNMVHTLLMCTTIPAKDPEGTPYAVRKQGAGMINLYGALTTDAYLTVSSHVRPKLELGDDPERTGVYTLSFDVVNFGDSELTYVIEPVLTTSDYEWIDQGYRATYVMTEENLDISDMMTFTTNHDNNTVTVPAGETVSVEIVMTLNDEGHELMQEVYPFGGYMEGFAYLRAQGDEEGVLGADLTMCYLGFYGSWSEVPVVDGGYYYDDPADDLSSMLYPNTAASKYNRNEIYGLGLNPYFTDDDEAMAGFEFLSDRNTMSPLNEDKYYDEVDEVYTGVMRNLASFYYEVYHDGQLIWDKTVNGEIRKSNDENGLLGYIPPMGYSGYGMGSWRFDPEEGETYVVRVGGVPYMNNFDVSLAPRAYWEFPVTIDNIAPTVVDSYKDGDKLYIVVTDNHYAAFAGIYDGEGNNAELIAAAAIYEDERNAQTTLEFDMNAIGDNAYLVLGDYGCNESQYSISNGNVIPPLPEPPETDDTYYVPMTVLEPGEVYIIATTNALVSDEVVNYALSGVAAQPYDIRLQGVAISSFEDEHIVGGEKMSIIEWRYNEDGTFTNVHSGENLGLVEHGDAYWLGTTAGGDVTWSYNGNSLYHNSTLTEDTHLIYYSTIENSNVAAFDIFNPAQSSSEITVYKRVVQEKSPGATMTTVLRDEGESVYVDIELSANHPNAASGNWVVTFDPAVMSFDMAASDSCVLGEAASESSGMIAFNQPVPGTLSMSVAAIYAFSPNGGTLLTVRLDKTDVATEGTLVAADLICGELMADDNATYISTKASGNFIVLGGGEDPTEPPTSEPPTSEPPTTEPPTTEPPTTEPPTDAPPTDAPTDAPPTDAPTNPPTDAPPTDAPTDAPPTDAPTNPPTDAPTDVPPTDTPTDVPPTSAPGPVPPPTGDNARPFMILAFVIMGLSGIGYIYARRREAQQG